jgi:hypothetical protein
MTWLKLAPYIGALALIFGCVWWFKAKQDEAWHIGYRTAMEEVRKERDTERALYEHKREVADRDYQKQVSELETRGDLFWLLVSASCSSGCASHQPIEVRGTRSRHPS